MTAHHGTDCVEKHAVAPGTPFYEFGKKGEMLFSQPKRILGLGRLRPRGPCGASDEFHLAATARNLRKPAKLIRIGAPAPA